MNSAIQIPTQIWAKAKCGESDEVTHDDFYPERSIERYAPSADRARAVCRGTDGRPVCPVLLECLAFALITRDGFGIWGGLSARERNALRRGKTLEKYRAAYYLRDNPYYQMIETYLMETESDEESQDDSEREDEVLPPSDEV